ncbi:WD40 repeat-like protein [Auriscalpium vulgare]|uniref:WD40 repeat-like protein n=1 Tax=Auriscalpium vulgare TaxID=40419 RepID=A0ACB8S562_9AGAM|nr:WD40 repeat-like protein [Auriscalpium vulgare]
MPLKSTSSTKKPAARPSKRAKEDIAPIVKPGKPKRSSPAPAPLKAHSVPFSAKGKEKERTPAPIAQRSSAKENSSKAAHAVKTKAQPSPSPLPLSFKLIAGSYEKLLYGLQGTVSAASSGELEWSLKPIFIFPAHVSSLKAVAASPSGGKWLATGSSDEIIKVWDLRRRREIGGLMQHEGSITHLVFPSQSHLLSASEDGTLCLFRARDWAVLRALKGHKGRINSVAVHPSGKVALSVGKDRTLRMWDLMRGRGSASTKLGVEGELVRWSSAGQLLIVQYQKTIDVYSTDLVKLHTVNHASRIHDVKFVRRVDSDDDVLLVAGEDKKVTAYAVSSDPDEAPKPIAHFVGHGNRAKAIDTLRIALPLASRPSTTILSSVSSDGTIHVYDLYALSPPSAASQDKALPEISPVAVYDSTGTRLTCVTLADGQAGGSDSGEVGKKRARDDVGEPEEEEEEKEEDVEDWPSEQEGEDEEEEEGEEA